MAETYHSSVHAPRTVLMFAGQGAQYYQMGRELFERDPAYRAAMQRCDAAAGPIGGLAVSELILSRPMAESERFDDQLESATALVAVGYSLAQALHARGLQPDILVGYSLGETIAAVIAGMLTLEDAFRLVAAQARIIATLPPGAMVAVLAAFDAVRMLPEIARCCELAAINSPCHCVVSLRLADLPAVTDALGRAGVPYARLPVRHGFHASLIDAAGPGLRSVLAQFPRRPPSLPVVSCMTATRLERLDDMHFWQVARAPIRFADTVRGLAAEGPCRFVEAGPTGTLVSFVKQLLGPGAAALPAINQFGRNLETMDRIRP